MPLELKRKLKELFTLRCLPVLFSNKVARQRGDTQLREELADVDQTGEMMLARLAAPERDEAIRLSQVDERLHMMKISTRLFITFSIPLVENHVRVPAKEIEPPKEQSTWDSSNTLENATCGVKLPMEDEQSSCATKDLRSTPMIERAFLAAFNKMPLDDALQDELIFGSEAEGIVFGQKLLGPLLPKPRFVLEELASDQAQANIVYRGIGQLYLKTSDAQEYEDMVDMRAMEPLRVREGFAKYGACAYFSGGQLAGIKRGGRLFTPGSQNWEHVKFAWRCSLFTWVTAIDHLVYTHLLVSNGLNASLRELPPLHPVRRALHVNIFGTSVINTKSMLTLAGEGGFLHRMTALDWEGGLETVLGQSNGFKFETWPQRFEACDLPFERKQELPLFKFGLKVWNVLHRFYKAYVDIYYQDDRAVQIDPHLQKYWRFQCTPQLRNGLPRLSKAALADQMTHACFYVTAYHQVAGDVVQYITTPTGMFFQIREGQTMADAEMLANTMTLTASTGRQMPLLTEDWSHILDLTNGQAWSQHSTFTKAKSAWQEMQDGLRQVSKECQDWNNTQKVKFTEMDPIAFECSTSI